MVKIELMMGSTVLMLRWCSSQMAVLVSPSAMSARTSRSRGLRWSSGSPSGSDDGRGRVAKVLEDERGLSAERVEEMLIVARQLHGTAR